MPNQKIDQIHIKVFPRLHLSLMELGSNGYRKNGGIGFCIKDPSIILTFQPSTEISLHTLLMCDFSIYEIDKLVAKLMYIRSEYELKWCIDLQAISKVLRHFGLGSGTAITLACIEALFIVNEFVIAKTDLQRLSGRGGTSGIGINTYFSGGLVLDLGRSFDAIPAKSSDDIDIPEELPLVLKHCVMPDWKCGIFTPMDISPLTLEEERHFFSKTCPLSENAVFETTYHAVCGVMGGVLANNFDQFCSGVNALQHCDWKASEIAMYGNKVNDKVKELMELGCDAVGMSSLGPSLLFFSKSFEETTSRIKSRFPHDIVTETCTQNRGREISID